MHSFRLLLTVGALLGVAACGTSDPAGPPDVATLTTTGPAAPAGPSAAAGPGIQMRVDTTNQERAVLFEEWQNCLIKNGAQPLTTEPLPVGKLRVAVDKVPQNVLDACADKRPIGPPELDPARNPDYTAQWEEYVQCLRGRGWKVHVTEPGSWTYDSDSDTELPADSERVELECTIEVFGGEK